jgi:fatty acid desaturase
LAIYAHTTLLILLGAILVESGIRITTIYFWLIVVIIFGILLTYDIITHEPDEDKEKEK